MSISPFDSAIYCGLLSDYELARLFSDAAEIRSLLAVEAALARAQGKLGVIPKDAAARIADATLAFGGDGSCRDLMRLLRLPGR